MIRTSRALCHAFLIALLSLVLVACAEQTSDEQQIREHLDAMTLALEEGHVRDFMLPIAEDFIAGTGGLNRNALMLLVRRERMAREEINLQRMNTEVEIIGENRATATFQTLATGGTGLLPDEGQLWQIETGWRKNNAEWMLISASWERSL